MINYCKNYWNEIDQIITYIKDKEKLIKKSILITGAGGLICSTICDTLLYLNKKYNFQIKLFFAGRNKQKLEKRFYDFKVDKDWRFQFFDGNQKFVTEEKFDYIIHGASYGDPVGIMKQPVETMLCNFSGVYNLLDILRHQQNGKLLFISSSEVYGKSNSTEPFEENDYGFVDLLLPRSCYPNSKRAAETLCTAFNNEYGINSVIVRPGHIYGPQITDFDSRVSAELIRKAKNKEILELRSSGNQIRSYTYSLDCASAILTILINGENCCAYNISNKNSICTIKQFADCLAKEAGVNVSINSTNNNEKKSWNAMENSSLNSNKLEELGWKGIFNLSDGIKSSLKFLEV